MTTEPLQRWLAQRRPNTRRFPYDSVMDAYQHHGKQFIPETWTTLLQTARERLPHASGPHGQLTAFLNIALDKTDNRYDYRSYLALPLLPIPDPDRDAEPEDRLLARRDRFHHLLLSDLIAFELHALDTTTAPLPQLRPNPSMVRKRLRHAARAVAPALRRLSFDVPTVADPVAIARRHTAMTAIDRSTDERLTLRTTMLPVSTVHDEYLFIRVLQTFELTFGLLAVDVTAVITAVAEGRLPTAGIRLTLAATLLRETAPLWSLLATMQPQAFHSFRTHTDGASAIQSRAYKLVESLCSAPDPQRLNSTAYLSVPDVHARISHGQTSLNDALDTIRADNHALTKIPVLAAGMRQFAAAVHQWRRTHYSLAVRMLGTRQPGTGATPGTPYLRDGRDHPIFRNPTPTNPSTATSDPPYRPRTHRQTPARDRSQNQPSASTALGGQDGEAARRM